MTNALLTSAHPTRVLVAQSPAKINLTLRVLRRRGDGYHEISSIVAGVELFDRLVFQLSYTDKFSLRCNSTVGPIPNDEGNLVLQAAKALAESASQYSGGIIKLNKRIPLGAGLGGGSGNAAATLLALSRMWGLDLPLERLAQIGAQIGSDIPLFFNLPSTRISGRGEIVEKVQLGWSGWVLLAFAGTIVPTQDVYGAWRPSDRSQSEPDSDSRLLDAATADEVADASINELQPAVFRVAPVVQELHAWFCKNIARKAHVTGAGQTVFTLFDDVEEAQFVKSRLELEKIGTGAQLIRVMNRPMALEEGQHDGNI